MDAKLIAGGALALLVGACAGHSHELAGDADIPFVRGRFEHGATNRLVVETADRRYHAEGFRVVDQTDWTELSRRYRGADRKHWDRIFAGLDRDHGVYSATATLRSGDGAQLACTLTWQARASHAGQCSDESGQAYQIRFE